MYIMGSFCWCLEITVGTKNLIWLVGKSCDFMREEVPNKNSFYWSTMDAKQDFDVKNNDLSNPLYNNGGLT